MTVSQVALAAMLLSCFLGGIALALLYDVLLIPRTFLCGSWLPWICELRVRWRLPSALKPWLKLSKVEHNRADEKNNRKNKKWKRVLPYILTAFADIVFCVIAAVLLILLLYVTNDGAFRCSALFSMLGGILLGRALLTHWMALVTQTVYTVLRAGLIFLVAALAYPLTWSAVRLWLAVEPMRRQLILRWQQIRLARKQKKQKKKQAMLSQTLEMTEAMPARPQPDGRRVVCAGRTR